MHNNYFLLAKLTSSLENRLLDSIVSECFSQNKDELIIRFEGRAATFVIKASLLPAFSCLSFPARFDRARKNSADIFGDIIGQRVEGIRQYMNERSFAVRLSNNFSLLFKMHGPRSNIVLFRGNEVDALFKNNLQGDLAIHLNTLDRHIDWTFENFVLHQTSLPSAYFTFGKVVWKYLRDTNFSSQITEQQWPQLKDLLQRLTNPTYYITEFDEKLTFSLLPVGQIIQEHQDPIKALNEFFTLFTRQDAFAGEMSSVLAALKAGLRASENYYEKTLQRASVLQTDNNYKVWADLVMANLHVIKAGDEKVILLNFYDQNRRVEIKLKKELSPVKNAEAFYAKSKNQQLEITRLQRVLASKEKEIGFFKDQLLRLASVVDLKTLRSQVASLGLGNQKQEKKESLPYHEFEYDGFKILVGKNSKSNDKLTMKHSYKEDLWLHAKDVAGSHVLIKYQAGRKFPKDVIERAAQLAAYNSKRKTESLCPVIVTPRKYVRKRKGDPTGTVIVEREEIILVEPKL